MASDKARIIIKKSIGVSSNIHVFIHFNSNRSLLLCVRRSPRAHSQFSWGEGLRREDDV